jgi:hypothetical protein
MPHHYVGQQLTATCISNHVHGTHVLHAYRLSFDRRSRERRLAEEATLNRRESRAAVTFAGVWLFLLPFGLGFLLSRGIAEPIIVFIQARACVETRRLSPIFRVTCLLPEIRNCMLRASLVQLTTRVIVGRRQRAGSHPLHPAVAVAPGCQFGQSWHERAIESHGS